MRWFRYLRRARWDRERSDELRSYIEIETEANIGRGMGREEARLAAQKKLGNVTLVREEIYKMNTITLLDELMGGIRQALRAMRGNPTFTGIAILTLGLGIGANTAIFSVVNGVMLKLLPYPKAEELVSIGHLVPGLGIPGVFSSISPTMYFTYRDEGRAFQDLGLYTLGGSSVTGAGDPEPVRTLFVTYGTLQALGVQPELGRWFSQVDDAVAGTDPNPVILSYGYWQRRFGGDRSVIGRGIIVDSRPRQIVGVMPRKF